MSSLRERSSVRSPMTPRPRATRQRGGAVQSALLVCACLVACASPGNGELAALDVRVAPALDDSAVLRYWDIQDALARGERVDETAWRALWQTPAFRWQAGDEAVRARIRGRMELAFQPDPGPLAETLAGAEGYDVIRWGHLRRQREQRDELGHFHAELMASTIVADALALARRFLPGEARLDDPLTTPIRLLFFAPDAFVDQDQLFVDLLHARDRGDGFVRLLAHELHHDLYLRLCPLRALDEDTVAGQVALALRRLQMEGLADRIDKQRVPLGALPGLSPSYIADYDRYVGEAPRTLAAFGQALAAIPDADDPLESARQAWALLHLGGHPEGFHMAQTIAAAQGEEALLTDVGDPFAFVRRFQQVQPLLPAETLALLDAWEAELRGGA